jgi:hypothetical protein
MKTNVEKEIQKQTIFTEDGAKRSLVVRLRRDEVVVIYETIINKFVLLLHEYFIHMSKSESLKTIENPMFVVLIGLNVVIHVFQLLLQITNDIDTTYYRCHRSFYFYLEYIEQMNHTNTLHNLNNIDAIVFFYKKAMEDIALLRQWKEHDFLYVHEQQTQEITCFLTGVVLITKTILFFKQELPFVVTIDGTTKPKIKSPSIDDYDRLLNKQVKRFLLLFLNKQTNCWEPETESLFSYITHIQRQTQNDIDDFYEFLTEMYKKRKALKAEDMKEYDVYELFFHEERYPLFLDLYQKKKFASAVKLMFPLTKT